MEKREDHHQLISHGLSSSEDEEISEINNICTDQGYVFLIDYFLCKQKEEKGFLKVCSLCSVLEKHVFLFFLQSVFPFHLFLFFFELTES